MIYEAPSVKDQQKPGEISLLNTKAVQARYEVLNEKCDLGNILVYQNCPRNSNIGSKFQ